MISRLLKIAQFPEHYTLKCYWIGDSVLEEKVVLLSHSYARADVALIDIIGCACLYKQLVKVIQCEKFATFSLSIEDK